MEPAGTKKTTFISYMAAFAFTIAMIANSVMVDDQEIILPEAAAMAIAMWVYKEPGWIRQPSKIFLAPSIAAVIGFIVNQLHMGYLGKVIITLVLVMLLLRIIQSSFAPAIATGLFPVVINANEWSFILSAMILTFLLMFGVLAFELNRGLENKVKIPYKYMLVFLVLIIVWSGVCWAAGYPHLAVIPPILVVVYESLQKPMYNGKMAVKQGLVLTLSATIGTLLYFAFDSLIVVTLLDMVLMFILLLAAGMRLPAAYAFPVLPFVFPHDSVARLPLTTLITSVFLLGSVLVYKKFEIRQKHKLEANRIGAFTEATERG